MRQKIPLVYAITRVPIFETLSFIQLEWWVDVFIDSKSEYDHFRTIRVQKYPLCTLLLDGVRRVGWRWQSIESITPIHPCI